LAPLPLAVDENPTVVTHCDGFVDTNPNLVRHVCLVTSQEFNGSADLVVTLLKYLDNIFVIDIELSQNLEEKLLQVK
jgi:hypothetical protein